MAYLRLVGCMVRTWTTLHDQRRRAGLHFCLSGLANRNGSQNAGRKTVTGLGTDESRDDKSVERVGVVHRILALTMYARFSGQRND